jgi:hypothetical protein
MVRGSSTYTLQTIRTPNLASLPVGAMQFNSSGNMAIKIAGTPHATIYNHRVIQQPRGKGNRGGSLH